MIELEFKNRIGEVNGKIQGLEKAMEKLGATKLDQATFEQSNAQWEARVAALETQVKEISRYIAKETSPEGASLRSNL